MSHYYDSPEMWTNDKPKAQPGVSRKSGTPSKEAVDAATKVAGYLKTVWELDLFSPDDGTVDPNLVQLIDAATAKKDETILELRDQVIALQSELAKYDPNNEKL